MTTRPVVFPGGPSADGRYVGRRRRRRRRCRRRRARQPASTPWLLVLLAVVALAGRACCSCCRSAAPTYPIVISLLNAFTGLTVAASGYVLDNVLLLVAGTLVGATGTILTRMMAAAMGRSTGQHPVRRVQGRLDGRVDRHGRATGRCARRAPRTSRSCWPTRARSSIVPGYGLAVAQAQHTIHELAELLEARGVEVIYGIHPVAGRMPGHMNVLLAEANVPYEQLKEMDEANSELPSTDVALVVGANDVVNPAADTSPGSPIYGMPILRRGRGHRTWCSSSARCGPGSPASRTSCSTSPARRCSSATPRTPSPRSCSPQDPLSTPGRTTTPRRPRWAAGCRRTTGASVRCGTPRSAPGRLAPTAPTANRLWLRL